MGAEANSGGRQDQAAYRLHGDGWTSPPLLLAVSSAQRRIGSRPVPGPFGVILRCRSVHGFGMRVPLDVVALDGRGRVLRSFVLRPRRVAFVPGAVWIAEMASVRRTLPPPGKLVTVDRLGPWPGL